MDIGQLSADEIQEIITTARDDSRVNGLTHNFYKYPARMPPSFVRAAIEAFTDSGDWILDPFVGGGTTLVEARALGRSSIGIDNNELAVFVSKVKTTYLSDREQTWIRKLACELASEGNLSSKVERPTKWIRAGYLKNLNSSSVWRIRKIIEIFLERISRIRNPRSQSFLRCAVLQTAQWALDNRRVSPSVAEFRSQFLLNVDEMLDGMAELKSTEECHLRKSSIDTTVETRIFHTLAQDIDKLSLKSKLPTPKLVITSPPYPGVHVLYHRWQIHGRRETPAPYWIAGRQDGHGETRYTFGWRQEEGLPTYFENLEESFRSIQSLLDEKTVIIQMVAFSEPSWQLPRYLDVLEMIGLKEMRLPTKTGDKDGRLWRDVPNRKWYAHVNQDASSGRELILIHKLM